MYQYEHLDSLSEVLDDPAGEATDGRSIWKSQLATAARTGVDGEGATTDARHFDVRAGTTATRDDAPHDEDVPTPPPSAIFLPPHEQAARCLGTAPGGSTMEAEPATPRLPGQRGPESMRASTAYAQAESTRPEIPAMMGDEEGEDDGRLEPLVVDVPRDIMPTLAPPRPQHVQAQANQARGPLSDVIPPVSLSVLPPISRGPVASLPSIPPPEPSVAVLLETDAIRLLGRAVANRHTGCLCFEGDGGLRRVVLRDGDLVAVGSSIENESLVAYLTDRGELPRDVGKRLAGRVPPFGRLAGAALIAAGHLMQDRLWEVLR